MEPEPDSETIIYATQQALISLGYPQQQAEEYYYVVYYYLSIEYKKYKQIPPIEHSVSRARYAIRSQWQREIRKSNTPVDPEKMQAQVADTVEYKDRVEDLDYVQYLSDAAQLDETERKILHHRYADGMTYEKIGKEFNKTKVWAYNKTQNILDRLRAQAGDD